MSKRSEQERIERLKEESAEHSRYTVKILEQKERPSAIQACPRCGGPASFLVDGPMKQRFSGKEYICVMFECETCGYESAEQILMIPEWMKEEQDQK